MSVACLLGLNSCFKTDEDVFDKSPAERLNEAKQKYTELLTGATDGWVMQYFANQYEQGYPMIVKFDKNTAVTVAANNSVSSSAGYQEETSTWSIVNDFSSCLSFDTYNSLLHAFSDPGSDGLGHEGDYEFQIQRTSANQDTIYCIGKKTSLEMRLVRFTKGESYTAADGSTKTLDTWADYFSAISAKQSQMFSTKLPKYILEAAGERFEVTGMGSGVMSMVPEGISDVEAQSRTYTRGIIVNLDGSIRLSSPFTGENGKFSIQNFKFNDDKSKLVSIDANQDATITPLSLSTLAADNKITWTLNKDGMTGKFAEMYTAVNTDLGLYRKGTTLRNFQFGYDSAKSSYFFGFKANKYSGKYYVNVTIVDEKTIKLEYTGNTDNNGAVFYRNCPSLKTLLDLVSSGNISLSAENPFTPTAITMAIGSDSAVLSL